MTKVLERCIFEAGVILKYAKSSFLKHWMLPPYKTFNFCIFVSKFHLQNFNTSIFSIYEPYIPVGEQATASPSSSWSTWELLLWWWKMYSFAVCVRQQKSLWWQYWWNTMQNVIFRNREFNLECKYEN